MKKDKKKSIEEIKKQTPAPKKAGKAGTTGGTGDGDMRPPKP